MVDHVRTAWRVSARGSCRPVPVDRSTYHFRSKRAGQVPIAKRIREIAETRVRYSYRRIHVLLRREGWQVNVKRVCRLIASRACSCATSGPRGGLRPGYGKAVRRPPERARSGPLTSSTPSPGCRRRSMLRQVSLEPTLSKLYRAPSRRQPTHDSSRQRPEFISKDLDLWPSCIETEECERLAIEILPILGEPAAAIKSGNGALDDPSLGNTTNPLA